MCLMASAYMNLGHLFIHKCMISLYPIPVGHWHYISVYDFILIKVESLGDEEYFSSFMLAFVCIITYIYVFIK